MLAATTLPMDLGSTDVQSKAKQQRVKDTTKRRWRRWTENDVKILRKMQKDGLRPQAISIKLARTVQAIRYQLRHREKDGIPTLFEMVKNWLKRKKT
jgi:hypothetical protein